MGSYFRIQYIRVHRFWSRFLGHGIRKTSNARCQACQPILITDLEVTNTFLVFVVVAFLGFFPKAAFTLATVMFVPVMLILILIAIRSTFMVFAYSVPKYQYLLPGYFRYYWALNSSLINYRFTCYRGGLILQCLREKKYSCMENFFLAR